MPFLFFYCTNQNMEHFIMNLWFRIRRLPEWNDSSICLISFGFIDEVKWLCMNRKVKPSFHLFIPELHSENGYCIFLPVHFVLAYYDSCHTCLDIQIDLYRMPFPATPSPVLFGSAAIIILVLDFPESNTWVMFSLSWY